MGRRGFFAELEYQSRVSARNRERAERAAVRAHAAAVRQAEQARKSEQRMRAEMDRASAAERKRLEKEAREAHVASMEAEVEEKNAKLEDDYGQIDSILASTLGVDDFVDLSKLRVVAEHPPFDKSDLEKPIPAPVEPRPPDAPTFVPPPPPTGLAKLFGKKKYEQALLDAQQSHERALAEHQRKLDQHSNRRKESLAKHARAEAERVSALRVAVAEFARAREVREAKAREQNQKLEELIANLGYGIPEAIQEYVSIVLAHSVYPDCFPVSHYFSFDPATSELALKALIVPPDKVPTVKAYKYTKSSDEISASELSQKASRERYEGAVHQVALRSLHEVFEADRRGLIKTISLTVGTETIDPATGRHAFVPFVVVAAEREKFLTFDLSAVVPQATLAHLGASLSKNPYSLSAAEVKGVRKS